MVNSYLSTPGFSLDNYVLTSTPPHSPPLHVSQQFNNLPENTIMQQNGRLCGDGTPAILGGVYFRNLKTFT